MARSKPNQLTIGFLAALALLTAAGPFATDLYLPGMPQVAHDLNTTSSLAQLTLSAFMLGMAIGQLLIGVLSDATGRRRPMRWGAVIALLGVLGCALAPHIWVLIAARLLHGLGAGACLVVARAMIPDIVSGKETARGYTVLMMIQGIAPVIAPIVGGLLAEPIGWRGIFWVLVGIVVVQALVAFALPETLDPEHRSKVSPADLGHTFSSVLRNRAYRWYTCAFAFGFAGFFAYISASAFVIQEEWGYSPTAYACIFAVNASGLIISGSINNRLLRQHSEFFIARLGGLVMLGAALLTTVLTLVQVPAAVHLVFLFFAVAPLSLLLGNLSSLAVQQVPRRAGSASAVMGFFQFVMAAAVSPLVGLGSRESLMMGCCMVAGYLVAVGAAVHAHRIAQAT